MNREEEFAAKSLPERLRSITNEALWDYESEAMEAAADALAAERDRADRAEARLASVALSWAVIQGAERDILNGRPVDDAFEEQNDARAAIDNCLSEASK